MFSSELDWTNHPLAERRRGIFFGWLLAVAVVAGLVSARTLPVTMLFLVCSWFGFAIWRGAVDRSWLSFDPVAVHTSIFLGYAAFSALWALDPWITLTKVVLASGIGAGSWVLIKLITRETRTNQLYLGEGLYVGLLIGLFYFLFELLTQQAIKLWLYQAFDVPHYMLRPASNFVWKDGKLAAILSFDLTRNATPITLILWPSVMVMVASLRGWPRVAGPLALFGLAGAVVMLSPHETSKMALVIGLAVWGLATISLRVAVRMIVAGWIIACLAVLPAALVAYRLDLHKASWLQTSAQHRIVIWNTTAEQALKAPILGIGAEMTYVMGPAWNLPAQPQDSTTEFKPGLLRHAHNVFLQTWFELGLVGVVLLTLTGLAIIQRLRELAPHVQPYAFATFASAGVVAGSSYGMWQIWFMAMFGLCAAIFVLAVVVMQPRPNSPPGDSRAGPPLPQPAN